MKLMAIDLGKVRTGLAVSDQSGFLASPLSVITEHNRERLLEKLCQAAVDTGAELLIVGLPRNMDGSEGESAQNARAIGAALSERTGLPVEFWDERGTTVTAHGYMNDTNVRGKKRKAVIDAVAATVILQSYLDKRRMEQGN